MSKYGVKTLSVRYCEQMLVSIKKLQYQDPLVMILARFFGLDSTKQMLPHIVQMFFFKVLNRLHLSVAHVFSKQVTMVEYKKLITVLDNEVANNLDMAS